MIRSWRRRLRRRLSRLWRLSLEHEGDPGPDGPDDDVLELRRAVHQVIDEVADHYEDRKYNVAIARLMGLTNDLMAAQRDGVAGAAVGEALSSILLMLAPICPFVTEVLWGRLGHDGSVHAQTWPTADPALLVVDEVELVVQVNGRVRGRVTVAAGADEATAVAAAGVRLVAPDGQLQPDRAARAP